MLGISCDLHDSAACLLVEGELVSAVEEERLTRVSHDDSLPRRAVAACLATAGVPVDAVEIVAFHERPLSVIDRYLAARRREGPRGLPRFVRQAPHLFGRNLLIGYRIDRMLRELGSTREVPVRYSEHHESHAAAAFYPSPFDHAAIVTVDGLGEWSTATIGAGSAHRINLLEELRFPDSIGLLYSFVTYYCGFRPSLDEYKVMGLAAYGEPVYRSALDELATVHADGSLHVRAEKLGWYSPSAVRRSSLHRRLGGPPRSATDELTQREADLAASVQALTEDALLATVARAHHLTGEQNLCMAGGVVFNSVANGRVAAEGPFSEVWIQPAAGDAGSAVGAAMHLWHAVHGERRTPVSPDAMNGAFLGPRVLPAEVDSWIERESLVSERLEEDEMARQVARLLALGAIVGWFCGRMEFGPRALGHRSILADPRVEGMRDRLNEVVKKRELFRPLAPAILAERADEWFDLDGPSPYMLLVARLSEHRCLVGEEPEGIEARLAVVRSEIPACTHIDYSARVQTVDRRTNPEFHRLLTAFDAETGCPVLLNTSFNEAGEPIVATPDQALATARRCGLDALVIEGHLLQLGDSRIPAGAR